MEDWKELFGSIESVEPPARLFLAINTHVARERTVRERRVFFAEIALFLGAIGFFAPVARLFFEDLFQSGTIAYIRLFITDPGLLATYWKDLFLSIAESLPFASTILFLAGILAFLISLERVSGRARRGFHLSI